MTRAGFHRLVLGLPVALGVLVVLLAVVLGDELERMGWLGSLIGNMALALSAAPVVVGLPYAVFSFVFLQWSATHEIKAGRVIHLFPVLVLLLTLLQGAAFVLVVGHRPGDWIDFRTVISSVSLWTLCYGYVCLGLAYGIRALTDRWRAVQMSSPGHG